VAIITGASSGIGAGVAKSLSDAGATVVINYPVAPVKAAAEAVLAEILAAGGVGMTAMCDVSKESEVLKMFADTIQQYGTVDILINNAGITRDGLLMRMKDEEWDAVLTVNLKGAFICTRAASKIMSKQRYGRIINIASIVGQMGNAGQANYCASKAGLIGLTKSNARELARRTITVNAVAPGFIATDMTEALPEKVRQELAAQIPMERLGSADDIANAVLFLASDNSAYITGQVLAVNGGMYM